MIRCRLRKGNNRKKYPFESTASPFPRVLSLALRICGSVRNKPVTQFPVLSFTDMANERNIRGNRRRAPKPSYLPFLVRFICPANQGRKLEPKPNPMISVKLETPTTTTNRTRKLFRVPVVSASKQKRNSIRFVKLLFLVLVRDERE